MAPPDLDHTPREVRTQAMWLTANNETFNAVSSSETSGALSTLTLFLLVLAGGSLVYVWLWFNRTRLFDMPTIAESARLVEAWSKEQLGEREFSRRLLDFEQMVNGQIGQVLKLLASQGDSQTRQLAYCWLNRQGYGKKSVQWLWQELAGLEDYRLNMLATNATDHHTLLEIPHTLSNKSNKSNKSNQPTNCEPKEVKEQT